MCSVLSTFLPKLSRPLVFAKIGLNDHGIGLNLGRRAFGYLPSMIQKNELIRNIHDYAHVMLN